MTGDVMELRRKHRITNVRVSLDANVEVMPNITVDGVRVSGGLHVVEPRARGGHRALAAVLRDLYARSLVTCTATLKLSLANTFGDR
eukprot:7985553-Pyramimonas_sp.AAC.1